jgi:uncharacterized LabA/DUF88 family protein
MRPLTKTVAILVDGSNLYAANNALGLTTDYKKLITYFGGEVLRAAYFTALPPSGETSSLRPMVDYLEYNGWTVYQKETRTFIDVTTGREKIKGNVDIEMSVVAMELAPYITDLVLFSGDGDFRFLVEKLQRSYAVSVTVVSTLHSRPPMCADILRRQADKFIDLVDIQADIGRAAQTPRDKRFKFGG